MAIFVFILDHRVRGRKPAINEGAIHEAAKIKAKKQNKTNKSPLEDSFNTSTAILMRMSITVLIDYGDYDAQ